MAKRLSQGLGVDIGTQSIKIAAVRQGAGGPAVVGLGMCPTPDGTVDHTGIFDPQTLGAALRALLGESGISIKQAVFCINGQSSVVVRILEVPRMSDAELSEHMQWEIQRNIPFAESTIVSDYRPIDNPNLANSQNMEVVMAVSPQSAIDSIVALLKAAGCKPAAIDVEPLGLSRVLKSCHYNDIATKDACVVHIGHSSTAINMYRQGVLAFPRTVPLGGSSLTKAIADAFTITFAEAEEKKRTQAAAPESGGAAFGVPGVTMQPSFQPYNPFSGENEGGSGQPEAEGEAAPAPDAGGGDLQKIQGAMVAHLDEFAAELRRSVDYYKSRGGEVETIALSGGGANLRGLDMFIEKSLSIPVTKINPFQGIEVSVSGSGETYVQSAASEFAVAVGMGLHIAYD